MTGSPNLFSYARFSLEFMLLVGVVVFSVTCTRIDDGIVYPSNAPRIFSHYGDMWSPGGMRPNLHRGLDIEGRLGTRWGGIGAPVLAAADGIVIRSHWSNNGGYRIAIEHGADENGKFVITEYLHNSENLVTDGERVKRGQQIATVGHTGAYRGRDPHLHFAVYIRNKRGKEWTHVDPHDYWYDGPYRITCFDRETNYLEQPIRFTYPVECKR